MFTQNILYSLFLIGNFTVNLLPISLYSQLPTDNPVRSFYGNGAYPVWTEKIAWVNVIDMSVYANGNTLFQKFENARDELFAQGGGVLYYPVGTYTFDDAPFEGPTGRGLMLKTGVVIRGARPMTDSIAIDGTMLLPTKFVFKKKIKKDINNNDVYIPADWSFIGAMPGTGEQLKDINNCGIAWVHLDGGTIFFGPSFTWGATYATAGAWYSSYASTGKWANRVPDGTHPFDAYTGIGGAQQYTGVGSGRLVFGCIIDNAAVTNDSIIDLSKNKSFGYYMYKFGARICVYAQNAYIANNLLPKSTQCFKYQQLTGITQQDMCGQYFGTSLSTLIFDYGKTFGIEANKGLLNLADNKDSGFYARGVIVQDNYVYNHGSKGFEVSGSWVSIVRNKNVRDYLSEGDDVYGLGTEWELTLDGWFQSLPGGNGCLSDNLSRAFDIGGKSVNIDSNYYDKVGSDPGNDGEGILCQLHGGTDIRSWTITRNTKGAGGEGGYMAGYDVMQAGVLIAWNAGASGYGCYKAGTLTDAAYVANDLSPSTCAGVDLLTACPAGTPTAPSNVSLSFNVDTTAVIIAWTDNADNEIGFRIDKKVGIAGNWKTIAFRPRKSSGTIHNEQRWYDFCPAVDEDTYYRVVTVNCDNDLSGASDVAGPICISSLSTGKTMMPVMEDKFAVLSNPVTGSMLTVHASVYHSGEALFVLVSAKGTIVMQAEKHLSANVLNEISLPLQNVPRGFYYLIMRTKHGSSYRKLVII